MKLVKKIIVEPVVHRSEKRLKLLFGYEISTISKKYNLTELYKKEYLQICEIAEMQESTTKNYLSYFLTFLKKGEQLPIILNNKELSSLFSSIKNIKHKSLMLITYAAGLRRNETLELRVKDIDFERNEIRVNKGKGNKDRITLLSENSCYPV